MVNKHLNTLYYYMQSHPPLSMYTSISYKHKVRNDYIYTVNTFQSVSYWVSKMSEMISVQLGTIGPY